MTDMTEDEKTKYVAMLTDIRKSHQGESANEYVRRVRSEEAVLPLLPPDEFNSDLWKMRYGKRA